MIVTVVRMVITSDDHIMDWSNLRFSSASSCSAHSARRLPSELGTRLGGCFEYQHWMVVRFIVGS